MLTNDTKMVLDVEQIIKKDHFKEKNIIIKQTVNSLFNNFQTLTKNSKAQSSPSKRDMLLMQSNIYKQRRRFIQH